MDKFYVNITIKGSQYWQKHIEIQGGRVLAWVSTDHSCIFGQKFDNDFKKIGSEFTVSDDNTPKEFEIFKTQNGFSIIYKPGDGQLYASFLILIVNY